MVLFHSRNLFDMDPSYFHACVALCLSIFLVCQARPSTTWDRKQSAQEARGTTETYQARGSSARGPVTNRVHKHSGVRRTEVQNIIPSQSQHLTRPGSRAGESLDSETLTLLEAELWSQIEPRLRLMEGNLLDTMNDKMSRLNNTVTIDFLYNVYHYLIEEVEIGKKIGEMRADEIEKVRRVTIGQGKDIVKLEKEVSELKDSMRSMSTAMEEMRNKFDQVPRGGHRVNDPTPSPAAYPIVKPTSVVKPQFPPDCQEIYELGGMKLEGDYYMNIQPYLSEEPFESNCRVHDNAGWLVIQKRMDGSTDFYRDWETYKNGFGDTNGEFWLGNDHIYEVTNQGDYMLRIQMSDFDGHHHFAEYDHFRILDEDHHYQMHVHGYHGDAGDSLTPSWNNHDGQRFSTYDRDNDDRYYDNCAENFHGAWWFKSCFESHLNGLYYHKGKHDNWFKQNGIQWNTVGHHYSLKSVIMMIKPNRVLQHPKVEEEQRSNQIQ